jgi:ribosome biogenesis GTPase / thiamine phosphate phosphatase
MDSFMNLEHLGHHPGLENFSRDNEVSGFETGRVIAEHRERYVVKTIQGDYEAEITGNLRFTAGSREDFPAVGDWVALATYESGFAIIHKILPRTSVIKRQAVGQFGVVQVIAANIDYAFLVQAADRDFNLNRLERYLAICHTSGVSPIIILTKTDLVREGRISEILEQIRTRIKNVPLISISNTTMDGYESIRAVIEKGKTYCLLGSSGVGKSTLLNNLSGRNIMQTGAISQSTGKGRHVTSHREMIVLENGGILIDNPGMREVGVADSAAGLEVTFDQIVDLSKKCRFKDCTHSSETGCAVLQAVEKGEIDKDSWENYLKIQREKTWFESTLEERKNKERELGKIIKNYKKDMKKNRH